jgi:hypothetical protein
VADLVDLPCVLETFKTTDAGITLYKSADIGQALVARRSDTPGAHDARHRLPSGITPPTRNIRRAFRKLPDAAEMRRLEQEILADPGIARQFPRGTVSYGQWFQEEEIDPNQTMDSLQRTAATTPQQPLPPPPPPPLPPLPPLPPPSVSPAPVVTPSITPAFLSQLPAARIYGQPVQQSMMPAPKRPCVAPITAPSPQHQQPPLAAVAAISPEVAARITVAALSPARPTTPVGVAIGGSASTQYGTLALLEARKKRLQAEVNELQAQMQELRRRADAADHTIRIKLLQHLAKVSEEMQEKMTELRQLNEKRTFTTS